MSLKGYKQHQRKGSGIISFLTAQTKEVIVVGQQHQVGTKGLPEIYLPPLEGPHYHPEKTPATL